MMSGIKHIYFSDSELDKASQLRVSHIGLQCFKQFLHTVES